VLVKFANKGSRSNIKPIKVQLPASKAMVAIPYIHSCGHKIPLGYSINGNDTMVRVNIEEEKDDDEGSCSLAWDESVNKVNFLQETSRKNDEEESDFVNYSELKLQSNNYCNHSGIPSTAAAIDKFIFSQETSHKNDEEESDFVD
jgi:hypothetical protein